MKRNKSDSLIWMVVGTKLDERSLPREDCNNKVNVI